MTREEAKRLAADIGFTNSGIFSVSSLEFRQEVRDMCRADKCSKYNRRWTCPPACGTLEESRVRAARYDWGLLVQTTAFMEDPFDGETMMRAMEDQGKRFTELITRLRADAPGLDFLPMSSSGCEECADCTYPDAPCRFPERVFPSMEAYGLMVSDTCSAADVPYYYGKNTVTFSGCVLFHEAG